MEKDSKKLVTGVIVVVVILAGCYGALIAYTGFLFPFSSVVSESMQHDNDRSEIGVIDTGDIVVVMDPSKADITSYVMGTQTGESSFGMDGSVIIYNRDNTHNPVIHRAIVWLDYNASTDSWSSSELRGYQQTWYCIGDSGATSVWNDLGGMLYIQVGSKLAFVNLDSLQKKSGYLTMGDNPVTNTNFDQSSGIINHPIGLDDIRSVPIAEIPWFGMLKLIHNNNSHISHVPNSLPSLIMLIVLIFSALFLIDAFFITRYEKRTRREISRIHGWKRDRRTPPPLHFHWNSKKGCTLESDFRSGSSASEDGSR